MPGPAVLETLRREAEYQREQMSYRDRLKFEIKSPIFPDLYDYTPGGDLYYKDLKLETGEPLTHRYLWETYGKPYNAPIIVTNLMQVQERAFRLMDITTKAASKVGYPHELIQGHYAAKANYDAKVIFNALKHVHLETTTMLELAIYEKMLDEGLITPDQGIKIVCNGFKDEEPDEFDLEYAQRIINLHNRGVDITPILDEDELPLYQRHTEIEGQMSVGLRLKFGKVKNDKELAELESGFGFDWEDLQKEADNISKTETQHLKFTMLHAMVSAAETMDPDEFVQSLLFAAEKWAILKQKHPSLTHLNMGGGIPSMSSGYDYDSFFKKYYAGVKEICEAHGVDLPVLAFESGSFIADDCESLVFKAKRAKVNSKSGIPQITGGFVLNALPDFWIAQEKFEFIAATNANSQTAKAFLRDDTCDSYNHVKGALILPEAMIGELITVPFIGAYQRTISGMGNMSLHHCASPEPIHVYVWIDANGKLQTRGDRRPSMEEAIQIAGLTAASIQDLRNG